MTPAALPPGKLPPQLLSELLPDAASLPAEILVGPRVGEDACAIAVEGGTLVAATDPITLTGSGVGRHAVVINANDVAAMGARPRWFLANVLLPIGSSEANVRALFAGMREALDEIDAALVGGHTEVTSAVVQPVVVGQMLGWCERDAYVRTGGTKPGDVVLQIGRTPVEGAAVLAEQTEASGIEPDLLARARNATVDPGISIVEPALLAASLGATALHDPTEGGLATALHEVAEAASAGIVGLDPDAVLWFEPGVALCDQFGADPWGTLASGALIACFAPEAADAASAALRSAGYEVAALAHMSEQGGITFRDGTPLRRFDRDELSRVL
jgi:hydrogenase expression/formation protein HypE